MKKGSRFTQISIFLILLMCIIVGGYYMLTRRPVKNTQEETESSVVGTLLAQNYKNNYPPTPKEVIKQYSEITKAFYNETYTEEELIALAKKIQELYDQELIDNEPEDLYLRALKAEIATFKDQSIVISSYATSASTDVDYFTQDGFQWARLQCAFNIRQGTQMGVIREVFLLRKDGDGHWKIYGWDNAENVELADNE